MGHAPSRRSAERRRPLRRRTPRAGHLLFDYTLWIWHFANHRVSFLWRFHVVHHVDRDLDSSTALRFHFGEHALSIVYRAVQIVVIGATPEALWGWQLLLFASILFHHANVELPHRPDGTLQTRDHRPPRARLAP